MTLFKYTKSLLRLFLAIPTSKSPKKYHHNMFIFEAVTCFVLFTFQASETEKVYSLGKYQRSRFSSQASTKILVLSTAPLINESYLALFSIVFKNSRGGFYYFCLCRYSNMKKILQMYAKLCHYAELCTFSLASIFFQYCLSMGV